MHEKSKSSPMRRQNLANRLSQIGTIREGGLYMPIDEATQVSKGFAFIEFSSPQARRVVVIRTLPSHRALSSCTARHWGTLLTCCFLVHGEPAVLVHVWGDKRNLLPVLGWSIK